MNKHILKLLVSIGIIVVPFLAITTIPISVAQNDRLESAISNPASAASTFPAVTTGMAIDVTETSVTLFGVLDLMGAAGTVSVSFQYGVTTNYGNTTTAQIMTATGAFSTKVTGLNPGTIYHYRAIADGGNSGSAAGEDNVFTTARFVPPAVNTTAPSDISATSATMKGYLAYLGSQSSVKVYFKYGMDASYGNTTGAQSLTASGFFSAALTNLIPGTTYHYRAVADSGNQGILTGDDLTFTTSSQPEQSLTEVITIIPSNVAENTATLMGNLLRLSPGTNANVFFEYGNTTSYGRTTTPQVISSVGFQGAPFNADIKDLTPGTTYHFRAVADSGSYGKVFGVDRSFLTLGTKPLRPGVNTLPATDVNTNSAKLNGSITDLGASTTVKVSFEYGVTITYGNTSTAQGTTTTGAFGATVTGLKPGTTYHYRAIADGGLNGSAAGTDFTFVTSAITPPTINTVKATDVTTNSARLNGLITDLGAVSTASVSFEYGLTTNYGNSTAPQGMTTTGAFSTNVTGLQPGTTYHYRAIADAGLNIPATGTDFTFVTLAIKPPTINTAKATDVNVNSAKLNGLITDMGTASTVSVSFEYGLTTNYGNTTAAQGMTTTGVFIANVTGLQPGTTYHYRAIVDAGSSGKVVGSDMTFTALPQTTSTPSFTSAPTTVAQTTVPTPTSTPPPTSEPTQSPVAIPVETPSKSGNLGITMSIIAAVVLVIAAVIWLAASRRSKT